MGHARQRILLVDDDPGIMVAVKQALITHGYEMTTAAEGLEALDAFEREPPELILLDLVMPQCSGLEVCQRVREYSTIPIIILSVKGSEADIVSALDLGADDYLVKPFRLAELLARVRAVLRRGSKILATQVVCGDLEINCGPRYHPHTNRVRSVGRVGGKRRTGVDQSAAPAARMGAPV
jgi:two-component system KDP operon response regulator KdpE